MDMPMSQSLIGRRPQPFGGLQLGRVRRQKVPMGLCGHLHLAAHMPPGATQHEEELLTSSCTNSMDKLGEGKHTQHDGHGGTQQPLGASRSRLYNGIEMAPPVALLHNRCWALPARTPDPAQDGHEPDAVLVVAHSATSCCG